MFSPEYIDVIISAPTEDENLEFKEAQNQYDIHSLMKYCVALANEGGGLFILGISNNKPRRIVGTGAFPNIEKIKGQIFAKLKFRVDVEEVFHPKGRVLVFNIPKRPQGTAYNFDGAYLMRIGEQLVPMTEDKLRRIFAEGNKDYLLESAISEISHDDVIKLLDTQCYFDLMQRNYPTTRESVLSTFLQENLIVKHHNSWGITNLGALLFARDLKQFGLLYRKSPRVVVYKGIDKSETIREQISIKGYALGFSGLIDFINNQLPENEVIGRALRTQTRLYPEIAIRELVANALVHQDIEDSRSFIMIEIFSDRIEISSPGKSLIPTDRFIDEYCSRNERLTDLMRRFRICEEKSSGIDRVIKAVENYQLPAPEFNTTENHTVAILFAHKNFDDMDRQERIRACYQHACLLYVSRQKMTNQSLRERFNLTENRTEVVSRIISDAIADGKIKLDDPDNRSRRYAKYIPFWG